MNLSNKIITGIVFSIFSFNLMFSQSDKISKLEERRQEILAEINHINKELAQTKTEKTSILTVLNDFNIKISSIEKLISITNSQANLLTKQIKNNEEQIDEAKKELKLLKEDYAKMIVKSYESKAQQSKLLFILSAKNFRQAYQRYQYLKEYTAYRRKQGKVIQKKQDDLVDLGIKLKKSKKDKIKILAENKKVKENLVEEKQKQVVLVDEIKAEEEKYVSQIKEKQRASANLDKQIDKLIAEAIALKNKKKTAKNTKAKIKLTAETKLVAKKFSNNKGKLPWPVLKGYKSLGFGKQKHPTVDVEIFSSGIEITTTKGAKARAVFKGKVLSVQALRGANKAVFVQHGNYITVYNNLSKVYVKKGESISLKQELGEIFTNSNNNKTVIKFLIYKDTERLNPESWLYRL